MGTATRLELSPTALQPTEVIAVRAILWCGRMATGRIGALERKLVAAPRRRHQRTKSPPPPVAQPTFGGWPTEPTVSSFSDQARTRGDPWHQI